MDALSPELTRMLDRLGSRLDQLATTILRAEATLMRGGVACALPERLGPVYRRRGRCRFPIARFRWPNVERLVGERRRQLTSVRCAFSIANAPRDSILGRLFWGILIAPPHLADRHVLEEHLWERLLESLARDLDDLTDVEIAFAAQRTCATISVVADPLGTALEVLIADILNERSVRATRATLREDVLEKVDIQVHDPLRARVQVTWTIDEDRLNRKVASLQPDIAVVSPRTLAMVAASGELALPPTTRTRLARILGAGDDLEARARSMRGIFEHAIRCRHDDPQGPVAAVPVEVREFVRECVASGALEVGHLSRPPPRRRVA